MWMNVSWVHHDLIKLIIEVRTYHFFPHALEFDVSDVDECTEGIDECDHNCHNTDGSYTCSCNGGYTLHSNGFTCIRKSHNSQFL